MLPSGPRSTYPPPSTFRPGASELVRQLLTTMNARIAAANEVRPATVTTGCDGLPNVNPLNGTNCNGAGGPLVLYNPATRTVLTGQIGRPFASTGIGGQPTITSATVHPAASCDTVIAKLKARRRFTDQNGNVYGPTGAWIGYGDPPAVLETDYVHRFEIGTRYRYGDPSYYNPTGQLWLQKTVGVLKSSLSLVITGTGLSVGFGFAGVAQGLVYPSVNDETWAGISTVYNGYLDAYHHYNFVGINDALFSGSYSGAAFLARVTIDSTGTTDTFSWSIFPAPFLYPYLPSALSSGSGVSITGAPQLLGYGISVQFATKTGHTINDWWLGSTGSNIVIIRPGVAVRGTLETATPCINGGFPNANVLLTTELTCIYAAMNATPGATGSHALVVRDPDTLALLYRKPLTYDATGYAWGDPPQKFCFSTNDEGLFFMHCYTVPVLASPPTPYPGAEFGSPNPRVVAVVSVNPTTFEPTITELITLQDSAGYTDGASFAVAKTV